LQSVSQLNQRRRIRSEFRVYAANVVMRRNRLKAELRTGGLRMRPSINTGARKKVSF
jgi:hypothetical protein